MTEWLHPFSILRWFRVYRLRWLHQWPVAVSPLLLVSDENTGDGCCAPTLLPHTMPASADTHGGIHSSDNAITLERSGIRKCVLVVTYYIHESVYIFSDGK